ncbi:GntR family transcriptional regulator [Thioclava electrotropha]|uniref:UTRA domain-containing protein n=1 Tax=Thioclava electrotropha TaxID=1549850 RepID=A0ABX6YQE4_9RHOB|nr:GntR family transcriptional regulator [Thioclava electrotropha]QPZ90021.1 UTRA domain-containing protein [Thioclava electrotropha]
MTVTREDGADNSISWQSIRDEMMARIRAQLYAPGELIPNEVDLAAEFGCARATVNRALRDLATSGFLDRRRKAGTRVREAPRRKATLTIPLTHVEVEASGARYAYRLLERKIEAPPPLVREKLRLSGRERLLHVSSLHLADDVPHMFENRWIVLDTVPEIEDVDLSKTSPNVWLVRQAPYTHGTMEFLAEAAGAAAKHLVCAPDDPVLTMLRVTWLDAQPITYARQSFSPSHRMRLEL